MTKVPLGFIPDTLLVPLDQILPSRKTPTGLITSVKFKQIRSSIDDVGLIEPLSVTAANKTTVSGSVDGAPLQPNSAAAKHGRARTIRMGELGVRS